MRNFHIYISIFCAGFFLGTIVPNLLAKTKHKYEVGVCVSNGLYLEKIIDIRKGKILKKVNYVLSPRWPDGKVGIPNTTEAWLVDEKYVLVDKRLCELGKSK